MANSPISKRITSITGDDPNWGQTNLAAKDLPSTYLSNLAIQKGNHIAISYFSL